MRRKILFLSSWYPNKIECFNGNFVKRHAEAVSTLHDVEVLHSIGDSNQKEKFLVEESNINGVKTVMVYYKNSKFSPLNFYRRIKAYKKGYALVQKPDLIHGNIMHNSLLFAIQLKKMLNVPLVISEHWSIFLKENQTKLNFKTKKVAQKIAKQADYILPVSQYLQKSLVQLGFRNKMQVIGNVVDTSLFFGDKKEKTKPFIFLHVSHLIPLKNPDKIITAAIKLHKTHPCFELHIGGDGNEKDRKNIQMQAEGFPFIKTFGAIPLSEVAEKMRNSHCFILFSDYENFPCVLLESLSTGTPCIATNVGGIPEIISEENGILIENSEDDLFLAMKKMLENYHHFSDSEMYHQQIKEKYSIPQIAKQFDGIYQKLWRQYNL